MTTHIDPFTIAAYKLGFLDDIVRAMVRKFLKTQHFALTYGAEPRQATRAEVIEILGNALTTWF